MLSKHPENSRKILRKFDKNYEIPKQSWWKVEKIFRKLYIKFGERLQKTSGISKLILMTFNSKNVRVIKSEPSRNHQN